MAARRALVPHTRRQNSAVARCDAAPCLMEAGETNAKLTWERLSEEKKRNIDLQARMLYATGGGRPATSGDDLMKAAEAKDSFKRLTEFERFSLYSMAMIEGVHFTSDSKTLGSAKKPLQHQNQTQ